MSTWDVVDSIAGEVATLPSYNDALLEAERRVAIHGQEFPYRYKGTHYPVACIIAEDRESCTLTIKASGGIKDE